MKIRKMKIRKRIVSAVVIRCDLKSVLGAWWCGHSCGGGIVKVGA